MVVDIDPACRTGKLRFPDDDVWKSALCEQGDKRTRSRRAVDQKSVRGSSADDLFCLFAGGILVRNADKAEIIIFFPDLILRAAEDGKHMRIVKRHMRFRNGEKDDVLGAFSGKIACLRIRMVI